MSSAPTQQSTAALSALDAAATSARGGFACMFSSSDEYESALIHERRAQGRYEPAPSKAPVVMFIGCALMVSGAVLLFA